MKIGLITNPERDKELSYTRDIYEHLKVKGAEVLMPFGQADRLGADGAENGDIYARADALVVLGGDGTILSVARHSAYYNIPILGINLGNLGYLAGAEKNDGKSAVDKVLRGDYAVEERMMLRIENSGKGFYLGLNEAYIRNKHSAHMISLRVSVNGQYIDTYRGDGVIIATPTGSTAYNLSAGGPVLKPDTSLIAITQVCPHNLYARPLVISGDDEVSISAADEGGVGSVFIDGEYTADIAPGEVIRIRKAQHHTYIIRTTEMGFYDILRRKMVEQRGVL